MVQSLGLFAKVQFCALIQTFAERFVHSTATEQICTNGSKD